LYKDATVFCAGEINDDTAKVVHVYFESDSKERPSCWNERDRRAARLLRNYWWQLGYQLGVHEQVHE
jgi:hypothetical protein